ncbi:Uma2 family endonuclease [Gloeobacter violaceus]|uniref:Glr1594 protein n=1 Tax=Gloeobacter violaceus (strain ATCC 29082 / PCC 7421) TaxID=251221 RepID=Q7NK84_GLOVI|nr:Uma2 family endonuclease [Gloeobacter violaceus]BAC89535.1 glr1594 [Gloeobacter violaceus PCC 7421]
MTFVLPSVTYPSSDGEPVAETFDHLYAILVTLEVLRQYLSGQQATVLANQFLYYAQGFPRLRVAPDVMVIFSVAPGGRDNYKIWEEGQVPAAIFEMTSAGTQQNDTVEKKHLYERLGVREYWLFDPRGEWVEGRLQGYRLQPVEVMGEVVEVYLPITDGRSAVLGLRLQVEDRLPAFYREDSGEKLLIPAELAEELHRTAALLEQERRAREQERQGREQERRAREQAERRAAALAERLRELGVDPDTV